ncbi:hypothetical protein [Enterococcus hulanensis]|uniref:hypothetical protein n=1 Tax=Enterococcus hulanensis TaxID=2559929 RepID=UPI0010F62B8E|nr:hypothetical protein [Enterococcus hulanensis]
MAFSTKYYYVKPIVPPITIGFSISGIVLKKFNARSALLLSETFLYSSQFYYKNDSDFARDLKLYTRKLEAVGEDLLRQSFRDFRQGRSNSIEFEVEYKTIDRILDKIIYWVVSPRNSHLSDEDVASVKELNFWIKKSFNKRKRKINSLYPKKEYFEFNTFLNACNDFLKTLGQHSLNSTDSLYIFFDIGSDVDWFLLNITDCGYHQSTDFKNLFSSNVRVNNDLVVIAGVLNILKQPSAIELYLTQEKPFLEKVKQYKEIFQELLISGNRIINLETKRIKVIKDAEAILKETEKSEDREGKLSEIQSMHDVAVDKKIHNIH